MAKRFTDTAIWNREWFMDLSPTHKCLVRYLFDNCDACGVWKPNWKLASLHIGADVNMIDLTKIPKDQFEVLDSGKIFLPDFVNFQYGKLSKNSPAHNPVFIALEKNNLSNRVFNRVHSSLQEKEEVKEKEKEKEMVKDTSLGKSENPLNGATHLVGKMAELWQTSFPAYTRDEIHDSPACKNIADFIFKNANVKHGYGNTDEEIKVLNTFQLIADQVNRETFWCNKPLKAISNHIQEFYNKIKNPLNATGKNKSGNGQVDDNTLKRKLDARDPSRKQTGS